MRTSEIATLKLISAPYGNQIPALSHAGELSRNQMDIEVMFLPAYLMEAHPRNMVKDTDLS